MTTVNRRDFVTRSSTPLPVSDLLRQAELDGAAVRRADGNGNGRIEGPRERRALWDEAIAPRDRFERTQVVQPAFSFARPVASPAARRLAAVEHAAMVAAVPAEHTRIRAALQAEGALSMQPQCRSFFVPAEQQPARGMVMLLHGFSAGTWQYQEYAERFARQGYDVYVPRLEGHGHARPDGTGDVSRVPSSEEAHRWTAYADRLAGQVQGTKVPVHVVGLSGGGAVAMNLAARFPQTFASSTLLDPFLGPSNNQAKTVFGVADTVDRFTFGQGSRLLGLLPAHFKTARRDLESWGREGHFDFNVGHLAALSAFGASSVAAIEKAGPSAARLQVITTAAENVVDRERIARSVHAAGGLSRNGFFDFPAAAGVPHAMVSRREMAAAGHDPAIADRVFDMIFRFVDDAKPTQGPPTDFGA
jgi:alpha-beta hydrolase superfamily lysophospholipase